MQGLDRIKSDMEQFGLVIDSPTPDGKIHRVKDGADDDGEAGWYIGSHFFSKKTADPIYSFVFGSWKRHETQTSCSVSEKSKEHKNDIKKEMDKLQKKIASETKEKNKEAKEKAASIFEELSTEGSHPYLDKKKINGLYGARLNKNPNAMSLVVPMRDTNGEIHSVQSIFSDSRGKRFLAGGRVDGLFHLIGEINSSEKIVICEGFATGVSIHVSTGLPVACAFNAANLVKVAKELRLKYSDIYYIIAADNDSGNQENTGKIKAEEAAKVCLGKVVIPENDDFDFNDLYCKDGAVAVAKYFKDIKAVSRKVVPLGILDGNYFLTSSAARSVVRIPQGSINSMSYLLGLEAKDYWEAEYANTNGGVDLTAAGSDIAAKCRTKGIYDPKNVRKGGVWCDNGEHVYHSGENLFIDGKKYDLVTNVLSNKHFYALDTRKPDLSENPLSVSECEDLVENIKKLRWEKEEDAMSFIGWAAFSVVGGAFDWRPHLWLVGDSGAGKSFLMDTLSRNIIRNFCEKKSGGTTAANLMQTAAGSYPVIFDELETDGEKSARMIEEVLKIGRIASSGEDGGDIGKGTADGKGVSYNLRFSILAASIKSNLGKEQDANRFHTVRLIKNGHNYEDFKSIKSWFDSLPENYSTRFFSRSFRNIENTKKSIDVIKHEIDVNCDARSAQVYSCIVAGYWSLISDDIITQDKALELVDKMVPKSVHSDDDSEIVKKDPLKCLSYLEKALININGIVEYTANPPFDGKRADVNYMTKHITVLSAIDAVFRNLGDSITMESYRDVLANQGIFIVVDKNGGNLVGIRKDSIFLKNHFKDSEWSGSAWFSQLCQVDNAEKSYRFFHRERHFRALKIDYSKFGLDVGN